jgi:hypothetical protein
VAQLYNTVTAYVASARNRMQDRVIPYRYTDAQIVDALNVALQETQRVRPDIFLDLKYQQRIQPNDLDDGFISGYYDTTDIAFDSSGDYVVSDGTLVPIPSAYNDPIIWYIGAHLQFLDVDDTQDQRGIAFITKFLQRLTQAQS